MGSVVSRGGERPPSDEELRPLEGQLKSMLSESDFIHSFVHVLTPLLHLRDIRILQVNHEDQERVEYESLIHIRRLVDLIVENVEPSPFGFSLGSEPQAVYYLDYQLDLPRGPWLLRLPDKYTGKHRILVGGKQALSEKELGQSGDFELGVFEDYEKFYKDLKEI